jgi:hypothetical protein
VQRSRIRFLGWLDTDLAQAIAALNRMSASLESYTTLEAPAGSSPLPSGGGQPVRQSPLPSGEGQGVRAESPDAPGPHPNPLPEGEGTET